MPYVKSSSTTDSGSNNMEGVSANVYKSIKGYWRRRGYERINGSGGGRRRKNRVELAVEGTNTRKRRFWRIRLIPRLKLKLRFSPKKFVVGLRDGYVNFMTRLANSSFISSGAAGYPGGGGIDGFGMRPLKEYDERMIIEIYKSLMIAQGQLIPPPPPSRDGTAAITAKVTCRR